MTINKKIEELRKRMEREKVDSYIITKNDPHQSEYAAPYWNGVKFISGFSGSAGLVVVTKKSAVLWTDGRYFIQAENQLKGTEIELYRTGEPDTIDFAAFLRNETPINGTIGFDGKTLSVSQFSTIIKETKIKKIDFKSELDLLSEFWEDRPEFSKEPIFDHALPYCGVSRTEKINTVRKIMKDRSVDSTIISSLDDIAWLFNLRCNDIKNITTFSSYSIIDENSAALFVEKEKIQNVRSVLENDHVLVKEYWDFFDELKTLDPSKSISYNSDKTCYSLYKKIEHFNLADLQHDITTELKAVKNTVEIKNIDAVNIRDGAAMVRFIKWLKENVGKIKITEWDVMEKIAEFRSANKNFLGTSFNTIAGYMGNAAMMHYAADKENCSEVFPEGFILVDSGGQYLDGTTDITRTIVLGEITDEMKRDFTLVLKAHINLAKAIFLYGTTGSNLDILARIEMWKNGIDYKSGTGHGLGYCLNVHEGPQRISPIPNATRLEVGMLTTNEPGIYRKDQYGIRTENTILTIPHNQTEFGKFLAFQTVSFCPIDLAAVDFDMLSETEKDWLQDYHKMVYDKVSEELTDSEKAWLRNEIKC